jgi:hypothetical protein
MWVRITPPQKPYRSWLWGYFLWRLHSAKRAIKHPALWWKRKQAARRLNAYLLKEAEAISQLPPHTPPTTDEVNKFVVWAERSGVQFAHRVAPMPKRAPDSKEVDLIKTGIEHGN